MNLRSGGSRARCYRRGVARALVIAVAVAGLLPRARYRPRRRGCAGGRLGIDAALRDAAAANLDWSMDVRRRRDLPDRRRSRRRSTPRSGTPTASITARSRPHRRRFRARPAPAAYWSPTASTTTRGSSCSRPTTACSPSPAPATSTSAASQSADVALPRGWVHVAWTLFGQHSQSALACRDVPSLNGSGTGVVELFRARRRKPRRPTRRPASRTRPGSRCRPARTI